jgi:riboflavin synthase
MEEFLSEIMTELIVDVCQKEEEHFNESCLRHLASIVSEVTMEECKNVVKAVIRNERWVYLLCQ